MVGSAADAVRNGFYTAAGVFDSMESGGGEWIWIWPWEKFLRKFHLEEWEFFEDSSYKNVDMYNIVIILLC